MVVFPDGRLAYDRESAIDILGGYGLTEDDVTELAALVIEGERRDLAALAFESEYWKLIADDYYNAIASAINLIDEQLDKPRLRNVRQLLEDVKKPT